MISNCEKCRLPSLVTELESYKLEFQTTNANVEASQTPTQAQPYIEARNVAAFNLKATQKEYAEFLNIWRGFCNNCKHGA